VKGLALVGAVLIATGCRSTVVTDLDGRSVDPLAAAERVSVLLFVSTSCPISNRYAPEIVRIAARFAPRAVAFHLVYADTHEADAEVRTHALEHAFTIPVLRDPKRRLVAAAKATATPEAAVFRGRELVYHGRIDDRWIDLGRDRPVPTSHDLELTLDAVLDGKPIAVHETPVIGCALPP
jgi:hypothetical protein